MSFCTTSRISRPKCVRITDARSRPLNVSNSAQSSPRIGRNFTDGVVTSLKEEHENSASRIFSNDPDCLAPHVHSPRAKGSVCPCRDEMTLDVESVVGGGVR